MNNADLLKFTEAWVAASDVYNVSLSDAAVTLAFKVLQKYEFEEIGNAIAGYLGDPKNGRFAPKPANIVQQIQDIAANDGRPGADEAWSLAVQSFDENETVVLNNEIGSALQVARVIYLDGDKIGARMAFKSTYEKTLITARAEKKPLHWWPSLGHDAQGREPVLRDAVMRGQLNSSQVIGLLPAPVSGEAPEIIKELNKKLTQGAN